MPPGPLSDAPIIQAGIEPGNYANRGQARGSGTLLRFSALAIIQCTPGTHGRALNCVPDEIHTCTKLNYNDEIAVEYNPTVLCAP